MLTGFVRDNSQIITVIISEIVKKYKKVVIINDENNNLSTIYSFFNKIGCNDVEYVLNLDKNEFCNREHGKSNINGTACEIQRAVTIKSSDLSFYPCWKAAEMGILKFATIDFQDLYLIPYNIELATILYMYNPAYSNLKCDRCKYCMLCHKGCYVDNYIVNLDFFQPVEENCKNYMKEIDYLIENNKEYANFLVNRRELVECTK